MKDQLELELADQVTEFGGSARGLTRIHILLSSQRELAPREVDPLQYELFGGRAGVNRVNSWGVPYGGAPLLLPLP